MVSMGVLAKHEGVPAPIEDKKHGKRGLWCANAVPYITNTK